MTLSPTRLEPVFEPRLWGSRSLAPLFPGQTSLAQPVGEAWLTGLGCRMATGPFTGLELHQAWPEMGVEWRGTRIEKDAAFPLLLKFIFPEDKLSIQVHPDDAYAQKHERAAGGAGKTEMWYAVAARSGAEVLVGLKPGATRERVCRAIVSGELEPLLERIAVRAGDAIFVPAGTVHTIGPGLVLCEIQEYSDLTYRVFDYERTDASGKPRMLHIEKALDVIQFGEQTGGKLAPLELASGPVRETFFVACRYFAAEKWEFAETIAAATSAEHFDLLVFLDGCGRIECSSGALDYRPGPAWLLPAALGAYRLAPDTPTTLLRTYVPDIVNDFVRRLSDRRVPESAWSSLVYP